MGSVRGNEKRNRGLLYNGESNTKALREAENLVVRDPLGDGEDEEEVTLDLTIILLPLIDKI